MKINKDFGYKFLGLFAILAVAAILRFWNLGINPPGLTPDEAALGYNAYSILKTGKDEFGTTLPIIFKSFGDYKPGLYVYMDIPFIAAFGLNEVSTRLPSVVAGVISVLLIYLIVKQLEFGYWKLEIIAAFVAATNPWLIYFSRGAWEANVSLCLTLLGIFLFLKALKEPKFLVFSAASFALTLVAYQGAKLSTLIVLVILSLVYFKECSKFFIHFKKELAISVILGILIIFPIAMSFLNGETFRLNIFSIFSYRRPQAQVQALLAEDGEKMGSFSYDIFHSESLNYVNAILGRYFNNFSGRFLFFEGDWANPISTAPYQGALLLSDLVFLPLGIFFAFSSKPKKGHLLFFLWLLMAPLSAALSRDDLNAVRDLNLAIPMIIFISIGVGKMYTKLVSHISIPLSILVLTGIYIFPVVYFLDALFVHLPVHSSNLWRYGYKQAVSYISSVQPNYKSIVFEQSFNQPYIYFLFYQKYDPVGWQKQAKLVNSQYVGDVGFEEKLGNISFSRIDWSALKNQHGTLVVAAPSSLPPDYQNNAKLVDEIKFLNGRDIAFEIIQMK